MSVQQWMTKAMGDYSSVELHQWGTQTMWDHIEKRLKQWKTPVVKTLAVDYTEWKTPEEQYFSSEPN